MRMTVSDGVEQIVYLPIALNEQLIKNLMQLHCRQHTTCIESNAYIHIIVIFVTYSN